MKAKSQKSFISINKAHEDSQTRGSRSQSVSSKNMASSIPSSNQPIQLIEARERKAEKKRINKIKGSLMASKMRDLRASPNYVPKKRQTKSQRAGVIFPVTRILRSFKGMCPHFIVRQDAAVMTAGVIEYLIAEVLELSGLNAINSKKKRINPSHIAKSIREDVELGDLLKGVTLSRGGVAQFIHPVLTKQAKIQRKKVIKVEDSAKIVDTQMRDVEE